MRLLIILLAALTATLHTSPVQGAEYMSVCQSAAKQAEKQFSIPAGLLQAISLVETGHYKNGETVAWPWTVNLNGKGHYFDTRAQAEQFVSRKKNLGAKSIDIGCFQINTKWHGTAFETPLSMFEPKDGAAYAASFLSKLQRELGDWNTAVKSYHSRNADKGAAYGKKIAIALETLGQPAAKTAFLTPALREGPTLIPTRRTPSNIGGVKLTLFTSAKPLIAPAAQPLLIRKE